MSENPRMKITDVRLRHTKIVQDIGEIEAAWDPGGRLHFAVGGRSFVEIHTDEGLIGIGPAVHEQYIDGIKAQLLGKDPFDIEEHVARLRYYVESMPYRGVAGVDIALWDIIGKACGQPLYKLWGGNRDKVMPYASMALLSTPEERAEQATRLMEEGWKALKVRIHHATMQEDIRTVEAVRNAVGDSMEIMVDANQAQSGGNWQPGILWDFRRAVETARELQRLNCYWLEEPLPRFYSHQLAELNQRVEIPIAGGENNYRIHEFVQMLQDDVYDILQPESMVLSGVSDLRKIGVLAEAFGKKIVPHHGGGDLGVIAHLHLVASWSHAPYLELLHEPPIGDYRHHFSIMANPPIVENGFIPVPQGPGLGVEINPDLII